VCLRGDPSNTEPWRRQQSMVAQMSSRRNGSATIALDSTSSAFILAVEGIGLVRRCRGFFTFTWDEKSSLVAPLEADSGGGARAT